MVLLFVLATLSAGLSIAAASLDRLPGDLYLARALQQLDAAPWEKAMELISWLSEDIRLILLMATLALWALWRRRRAEAYTALASILALGLNPILKAVIARPRPPDDLVQVWQHFSGPGFPSGHAFSSVVVLGLLCYLATSLMPPGKLLWTVRVVSALLVSLIGLSRVWLGAHWPSDVVGGYLYGAIVLALLVRLHAWQKGRQQPVSAPQNR